MFKHHLFLIFPLFFSCASEDFVDHYLELQDVCLFTDFSKPIPDVPPEPCKTKLLEKIQFADDIDSFTADYGDQRNYILSGLYFLYNYPTEVPKDKKVFQIADIRNFMPVDLQNWMEKYPHQKLHQILFNYVLQTIKLFRATTNLNDETAGHWNPIDQSMNFKPLYYKDLSSYSSISNASTTYFSFSTRLFAAQLILHEAWHARSLNHDVYCPKFFQSQNQCDKTMNGPHGIETSYLRAILQGHEQRSLDIDQINSIILNLVREFSFIYSIPPDVTALKEKELLTLKPLDIARLEQLTPTFLPDKYSDIYPALSAACSSSLQKPDLACQTEMIKYFYSIQPNLFSQITFLLASKPLFLPNTLFQLDSIDALFSQDDNFYYLFTIQSKQTNRFLLNIVHHAQEKENSLLNTNIYPEQNSAGSIYQKIKQILIPWSLSWFLCRQNCKFPSIEKTEQSNRFSTLFLLSVLHTNRLKQESQKFLTLSDEETLMNELCQVIHRLGKIPLPQTLQTLPHMTCEELKNRM